jgi:hypothetical protein
LATQGAFLLRDVVQVRYVGGALAALLLGALLLVVYWPGLHGAFFFDDGPSILFADGVDLNILSVESLRHAWVSGGAGPSGRPVAQLSFALNHFFAGSFDPLAFKATNLVIHFLCAGIAFSLLLRCLAAACPSAKPTHRILVSAVCAAIWLLHPIQLLPVLHVVQRMTSLSALFLMAALFFHVWGRERADRAGLVMLLLGWAVLWPLSVLSKETGVLFPFLALAWEGFIRRTTMGRLDRFARILVVAVGAATLVALAYCLSSAGQWLWSGYVFRPFTMGERLMTEARVLWFYCGLIVAPRLEALALYHDDIAVSTGIFSPASTFASIIGVFAALWMIWYLRARAPMVAFGVAWFFVGHAMESTVLPLEIAHEHRNYLPLFGVTAAFGWAGVRALATQGNRRTGVVALSICSLAYFSLTTALRAHQFGEEVRRTQIESQHHRSSSRAQFDAGRVLTSLPAATDSGSPTHFFARKHHELAGELDPHLKLGLLNLIHLNCRARIPIARADVQELERRLRETKFAPADRNVLYALKELSIEGGTCLDRADVDALFDSALANAAVSASVKVLLHSWHADFLWLRERDVQAAQSAIQRSLTLDPSNTSNRLKSAQLFLLSGDVQRATVLLVQLRSEKLSTADRKILDDLLGSTRHLAD